MAKLTLLEIVQDILSSIDGDEVNSIEDTTESFQIAQVVSTAFASMTDTRNWPHLRKLQQFGSVSDVNRPTHMTIPSTMRDVLTVSYNKRKDTDTRDKLELVTFLEPDDFLFRTNSRNSSKDNVITVVDTDGANIYILNDQPPSWWTSFDDEFVVFDSFDTGVDDTLQNSKSQVLAYSDPIPFVMTDLHIPDLPSNAFSGLVAEAKSTASLQVNQIVNDKAEQTARRNNTWLARQARKANGGIRYNTNYGRGRRRQTPSLLERSKKANE